MPGRNAAVASKILYEVPLSMSFLTPHLRTEVPISHYWHPPEVSLRTSFILACQISEGLDQGSKSHLEPHPRLTLFSPVLQILGRRRLRCKTITHWPNCANACFLRQWVLDSLTSGREKTENRKSFWRQPTYPSCSNQLMFEHYSETSNSHSSSSQIYLVAFLAPV